MCTQGFVNVKHPAVCCFDGCQIQLPRIVVTIVTWRLVDECDYKSEHGHSFKTLDYLLPDEESDEPEVEWPNACPEHKTYVRQERNWFEGLSRYP